MGARAWAPETRQTRQGRCARAASACPAAGLPSPYICLATTAPANRPVFPQKRFRANSKDQNPPKTVGPKREGERERETSAYVTPLSGTRQTRIPVPLLLGPLHCTFPCALLLPSFACTCRVTCVRPVCLGACIVSFHEAEKVPSGPWNHRSPRGAFTLLGPDFIYQTRISFLFLVALVTKLQPVPRPRYAGNLSRQSRLPSRLLHEQSPVGPNENGRKVHPPKTKERERERKSFISPRDYRRPM